MFNRKKVNRAVLFVRSVRVLGRGAYRLGVKVGSRRRRRKDRKR